MPAAVGAKAMQPSEGTPTHDAGAAAGARRAIFLVWLFAFLLSYFFRSANAVIAPALRADFGLDAAQLGLMTSGFFAAIALAQLPLGAAIDRWGPTRVVPVTMLAAVVGALLFGRATDFAGLAAGRVLLGLGFSGALIGALAAFGRWFPERRFATVSGLLVGLGTVGGLFAGTPLAWLAQSVGWRAVFTGGAGVIALAALVLAVAGRDAPAGGPSGARRLRSPLGRGAPHRAPSPTLPPAAPPGPVATGSLATVLRDARFWRIAFLDLFCVGTLLAVQALWAGPYLADVHGLPSVRVGDLVLTMAVGVAIGNLASGALADRFGRGRVTLAFGAGFAACHAALALLGPGTPVAALALLYLAFGALGSFGVVLFAEARAAFPPHLAARAITGVNLVGIAGAMAVQGIMGAIIEANASAPGVYGAAAYRPAFALTTAIGVAALLAYLPVARAAPRPARGALTAPLPPPGPAGERTPPP